LSQKKPAARDISDLKARLGLKKKAPGAARPAGAGGVVAPPGAGAVPAPPGVQPAQPQVHVPDASKDPFGAMNAMAAQQAHHRAPEIIVVNDGTPVESVGAESKAVRYGKIAGFILGPLIVGLAVGQISSSAKRSNEVIDDAALIRDDLKKLNNGLVGLNDILLEGKNRGSGKFVVNDIKLTADLETFDFPKVDNGVVYQSAMYELPVEVVENLLYYYQELAALRELVSEHVTKSKQDAKAIDEAGKRLAEKLKGGLAFGALISPPSEDEAKAGFPPKVRIVELGEPLCDGKPGRCPKPDGFTVRENAQNLSWSNQRFSQVSGEAVSTAGVLFVEPTPVLTDAIAGGDASLAQTFYMKRVAAIDEKVTLLTDIGNKLVGQLNAKANESKKFTFFM